MSIVERVNQGESLVNWVNWLTDSPAVCWSVIMGDLSPSPKGDFLTVQRPSGQDHQAVLCKACWPFMRGIHWSPVNSPHRGQWRRPLMFSLICAWTNGWVNNRYTGDLRRHRDHYDVIAIIPQNEPRIYWVLLAHHEPWLRYMYQLIALEHR